MLKALIEKKYFLHVQTILKLSQKAYKIYAEEGLFVLKYHDDPSLETLFSRLNMLNLDIFQIPLKSRYDNYIETDETIYFSITPFIADEAQLNQDIRLHFYVKAIAHLHLASLYAVKVSDGFFEESLNYLEKQIIETKTALQSRMERIERLDYRSPSDWYFLMNYDHLLKALQESSRRVDRLEEEWKKQTSVRLSMTYQNFRYEHVIVKQGKIISLDRMAIAPSIYDLKTLFDVAYLSRIDITTLFHEYMSIHPLENYEKEWLLAFLFIPHIERKKNDVEDIDALFRTLSHLHVVEEFANELMKMNGTVKNEK